ncbi:MAG: serine/threonine protein kinase [Xanthomonadales bacterium]|nr:serine/threonine protein kinase [Xanthomonadales bacterium]
MNEAREASLHFARLREAFHACLAAPAERDARLEALAASDPVLALELHGLLAAADRETPPTVLPPGIPGYTLIRPLGRGATGVVWLARQALVGAERSVALKLLHSGRSALALQRFQREWRVLARLDHPSIARLLDAGRSGPQAWLALEYVDGPDYAERLPTLPLPARVQVLADICAAVAHAHARLVLHRDLKPANLRFGSDGRLRLLDFGIGRLLDEDDAALTLTGLPAGTRGYAAPEQWRGEAVGTAADVYALGRLLAEAHCGDPTLAAIAAKATSEHPGERYLSAAALGEDLADWLASRPPRSGVGSRALRLRARLRQWRGPLLAALAVSLALLVGLLATLQQAAEARREAERAGQHLSALLDVIAAASPADYAGRDPPASTVLIGAAARLQAISDADPDLIWQSQTAIGVGLINLGRASDAAPALEAALAALAHTTDPRTPARRLDTLRLLAHTADGDPDRLARLETQIRAASLHDAPAGEALSALATLASIHARQGNFDAAHGLLALAEPQRLKPGVSAAQAENYWRQRGWTALRERDLATARQAFTAAQAVIHAQPHTFSTLRIAELGWLRAEHALQAGEAARAQADLSAIRSTYEAAYPEDHPERAVYARMQARAALGVGDTAAAAHWLQAARAVANHRLGATEQRLQRALEVLLAAAEGRCPQARAHAAELSRTPTTELPHHAAVIESAMDAAAACLPPS